MSSAATTSAGPPAEPLLGLHQRRQQVRPDRAPTCARAPPRRRGRRPPGRGSARRRGPDREVASETWPARSGRTAWKACSRGVGGACSWLMWARQRTGSLARPRRRPLCRGRHQILRTALRLQGHPAARRRRTVDFPVSGPPTRPDASHGSCALGLVRKPGPGALPLHLALALGARALLDAVPLVEHALQAGDRLGRDARRPPAASSSAASSVAAAGATLWTRPQRSASSALDLPAPSAAGTWRPRGRTG